MKANNILYQLKNVNKDKVSPVKYNEIQGISGREHANTYAGNN